MINRIHYCTLPLLALLFFLLPDPVFAQLQTGGTNYSVYDLKDYAANPNDTTWNTVRFVLTHVNQNPTLVNEQLQAMCDNGQKKVSFMLWYMPAGYDSSFADSLSGKPSEKIRKNIEDVLALVRTKKTAANGPCFHEVIFRFAPLGPAHPADPAWSTWNETQYLQNRSFIFYARDLVTRSLTGTSIKTTFDLGAEIPNHQITQGQIPAYLRRLWQDYTARYGTGDSYGFSIAWHYGVVDALIGVYDAVGVRPAEYAVDIYATAGGTSLIPILENIQHSLAAKGEGAKPVIIQETYFTDPAAYQDIQTMISRGMNIRTAMQWQVSREHFYRPDGQMRHISTTAPDYLYYGADYPVPPPYNLSHACDADLRSVTLQWHAISSVIDFQFRLDLVSNNIPSCQYGWLCPASTDFIHDHYLSRSITLPVLPNETYYWWVHNRTDNGISTATTRSFRCSHQPSPTGIVPPTATHSPSPTPSIPLPTYQIHTPTKTRTPTRTPTPTATAPKPGDANGDGVVDEADYTIWKSRYGQTVTGVANGDFNGDGVADGKDYTIWLNNYGW